MRRASRPAPLAALLLVVAALVCLTGLAGPALAGIMDMDRECVGPACPDQIGCGQPASPPAASGVSAQVAAPPPAVIHPRPVVSPRATPTVSPPTWGPARLALAPRAPRAPPRA